MSYLTLKIISLIVTFVIMIIVIMNRDNKKSNNAANGGEYKNAFDLWLQQASIYDMQKMLLTSLVKLEPQSYKSDVDVSPSDIQSRMKILFDTLPKDLRRSVYPKEDMLLDYIQGSIEENPYLTPLHQKRDSMYEYFQSHFSDVELYDDDTFKRVMLLADMNDDKSPQRQRTDCDEDDSTGKDNKIDYKAIHNEMYYVEYKLIPHFVEMFKEQPDNTEKIIISIYENLVTLQNNLRKINPYFFGNISCEVCGDINGECLAVYEYPKPFDLPIAKYGAVYFNKSQQKSLYWTLEFSLNGNFVLGSKTTDGHANYGQRPDMSKEEFIHDVCQIMGVDETTLQPRNRISRKHMLELNSQDINVTITSFPHIAVCFYDYNPPSQKLITILEQLAQEYKRDIPVAVYDMYGSYDCISYTEDFNIMALPTVLFFKEGKEVDRIIGYCPSGVLKEKFEKLLV